MAARPPASLIYNPNAGRRRHGRTIEGIKSALSSAWDLSITPTGGPKEATRLAREAVTRGDAAVFAWGGDGTVREVVEGILGSPIVLGVLPGGTFNVVALAVGLPRDPVAAAAALVRGRASRRDVGLIGSTPFLMQATGGLDGYIVHHVRPEMKARFGMAGPVMDALRAFAKYRFKPFQVDLDGTVLSVTGAAYVNMAQYGGRYEFVPGARWDDEVGHALLYTGTTRLKALRVVAGIVRGRHHHLPEVVIRRADSLTFLNGPSPVHLQVDGDAWKGDLPATCRLARERIHVLFPQ